MIKGFIFDLDGVITDTAEFHYLAWKKLADTHGLAFDKTINNQLKGVSRMDSLDIILSHNNKKLTDKEKQIWATDKNNYYVDSLDQVTEKDFLPGMKDFLLELKEKNYLIGLGSASKNAIQVMNNLNATKYFDVIGDGDSVKNSKPAPDIFLYAAEKMGLLAEECVVCEDAKAGIEAAKRGGFKSVGIGSQEEVGAADIVFEKTSDINLDKILAIIK